MGGQYLPVTEIELEHGVSAGVTLRSPASGLVPIYEEHEARLERNIDIATWMDMDEIEKALIIATRRIRISIANLQAEADIRQSEREAKRKRKR